MTGGLRMARWGWVVAAATTLTLAVMSLDNIWAESRSVGSAPEYFLAEGQYRLSLDQARSLDDVGLSPDWHGAFVIVRFILVIATAVTLSALIWRRARGWAPLFLSWFLLSSVIFTAFSDEHTDVSEWLGLPMLILFGGGVISTMGLLLIFPDDRNVRWIVGLLAGAALLPLYATVTDNDALGDSLWQYGILAGFAMLVVGLVLQVSRAVKSRDRTGRDLLLLTVIMLGVFMTLSFGSDRWSGIEGSREGLGSVVWRLGFETLYMAVPLVYGLAVLWILVRRGHWDMDVQLKGSVGYAGLTSLLVLGYFAVVAVVQAIVNDVSGAAGSTFALAVSTAVIAAAFLPARARLQALVDRVFDRPRRDAEQLVASFEATIGRDQHPEDVAGALVGAVDSVFRPEHVELWVVAEKET